MVGGPLRIVYFGTPEFAVPGLRVLLQSRHKVVGLVCQPDRPRGRGQQLQSPPTKVLAESAGLPVLQPLRLKDEGFAAALAALSPDLAVVAAYGRLIPTPILELPPLGMINIHASLLPKYRGAAPIHRAVIDGETDTGVTIMRVVPELDAGPVFAVRHYPIGPDDTTPEVERPLAELGAVLALRIVDAIAADIALEVPQDHAHATYARKIERSEAEVDWTLSARQLHNLVRGLQPWPLVAIELDGVRCRIHRSAVGEATAAAPGTVSMAADGVLEIAAGDRRALRILQIQPEGKRVMPARDFLAGRRVTAGASVGPAPRS